jgi:predicted RNA-binding Zn ribbon-like protein
MTGLSTVMVVSIFQCMTDLTPQMARPRLVPAPRDGLCLEFANTRSWRGSEQPTERLQSFADVLAWCEGAKSLDRTAAARLRKWGEHHKSEAAILFSEVVAAREAIYRLFSAAGSCGAVFGADADALNRLLEEMPGRTSLLATGAAIMWRLPPARPACASLLAPVLWSAGDLLTGDRLTRVRLCANEKCLWLFLDDSKSANRRWCSMSSCGNRAKAHRHYMKKTKPEGKIAG